MGKKSIHVCLLSICIYQLALSQDYIRRYSGPNGEKGTAYIFRFSLPAKPGGDFSAKYTATIRKTVQDLFRKIIAERTKKHNRVSNKNRYTSDTNEINPRFKHPQQKQRETGTSHPQYKPSSNVDVNQLFHKMKLPYFEKDHLSSPSNKIQSGLKETVSNWRNNGDGVFGNQEIRHTPIVTSKERKMQITSPSERVTNSQQQQQNIRTMNAQRASPVENARAIQSQRLRHISRMNIKPRYKPEMSKPVIPHIISPYELNRATESRQVNGQNGRQKNGRLDNRRNGRQTNRRNGRQTNRRNGRRNIDMMPSTYAKRFPNHQRQHNTIKRTETRQPSSSQHPTNKQRHNNVQTNISRQSQNTPDKKRHQNTKVEINNHRTKTPLQSPPSKPHPQDPVDRPDVMPPSSQSTQPPKYQLEPDALDPIERPDGWTTSPPQNTHNTNNNAKTNSKVSVKTNTRSNTNRRRPTKKRKTPKYTGTTRRVPVTISPTEDPPEPTEAPEVP